MTGTIRFDDEHIVKFTLDEDNMVVFLTVILEDTTYTMSAPIANVG